MSATSLPLPSISRGFAAGPGAARWPALWKGLLCAGAPELGQSYYGSAAGRRLPIYLPRRRDLAQLGSAIQWGRSVRGPVLVNDGTSSGVLNFPADTLPPGVSPSLYSASFAAWFRSSSADNDMALVAHGGDSVNRFLLYFSGGTLRYNVRNNVAEAEIAAPGEFRDGRFHWAVGISRNSSRHELWVDGCFIGSNSTDVLFPTLTVSRAGSWASDSAYNLIGELGHFAWWSRALKPREAALLWQRPLALFERADPLSVWGALAKLRLLPEQLGLSPFQAIASAP